MTSSFENNEDFIKAYKEENKHEKQKEQTRIQEFEKLIEKLIEENTNLKEALFKKTESMVTLQNERNRLIESVKRFDNRSSQNELNKLKIFDNF